MNTYLIYTVNSGYGQKILVKEYQSSDIASAIQYCGLNQSDIICVKLKLITEAIIGL